MTSASDCRGAHRVPPGLRRAGEGPRGRLRVPDIPVRCRSQRPEEPPRYARPRFRWNVREVSGALGDLGTFLPHIIGAITVVGMAPAGILATFGLFYLFSGLFYGLPIAVQPMKAASAVVLIEPMDPGAIAGAGLVIGLFFLVIGATGLIDRLARAIPPTVASGLQLGLGLSLAALGIGMFESHPWLGLGASVLILLTLRSTRFPAALVAVAAGVLVGQLTGIAPPVPDVRLGFHLPALVIPTWDQVWHGFQNAVIPQIPLTLTNAIIVTAAVTRQLFPREVHPVSERNLAITTGLGNLLSAPFGGYPACHGAGGLTGHYRFGARTGAAPVMIGASFILLGVLLGDAGFELLRTIPEPVLGALLLFSGIDLAQSSRPQQYQEADLFLVLLMAAIGVAFNPAAAFIVGVPLAYALKAGWVRL